MAKKQNADFDSDVQEHAIVPGESEFDRQLAALSDWESLEKESGLKRVQVDVDGYWEAERSPIYGELIGIAKAIETDLGVTGIYAVKLLRPCAVRLGSKQDSDLDIMGPGKIVGVFHSVGLNPLKNMAGAKVAIRRKEKTALSGGRSMWTYDIIADGTRAPIEVIDNRSPENTGAPF